MIFQNSPAKINFFLKVLSRRSDGYHNISSLILPITNLQDRISLTPAKKDKIITQSKIPLDENNLCLKAVEKYFSVFKETRQHFAIEIKKNIPVGAGLGGGSSNAMTTLLLLNKFFSYPLSKEELLLMASQIGCDVPFFLYNSPCLVQGLGDKIKKISFKAQLHFLLIFFPFEVSADWAYKQLKEYKEQELVLEKQIKSLSREGLEHVLVENHLALAVKKKFPILEIATELLESKGAYKVEMSGSGPSLFSLFESKKLAMQAQEYLEQEGFQTHYYHYSS